MYNSPKTNHIVIWSGKTPITKQITLGKATDKRPISKWKLDSLTLSGSGRFLKFQLAVKFLLIPTPNMN
jgi:hypothetical protein